MINTERIEICGLNILLHPHKALYIPEESTLVVSDLHLGKIEHFRKNGLAVPLGTTQKTIIRLHQLIEHFEPLRVVFLGDLFHSEYNRAIDEFKYYLEEMKHINYILVKGNHDILHDDTYTTLNIYGVNALDIGQLVLTHEAVTIDGKYNIHGHVHPAVRMKSKSRQQTTLSCFIFSEKYAVMPAFGQFTGKFIVKPKQGDTVFVVFNDAIMKV